MWFNMYNKLLATTATFTTNVVRREYKINNDNILYRDRIQRNR